MPIWVPRSLACHFSPAKASEQLQGPELGGQEAESASQAGLTRPCRCPAATGVLGPGARSPANSHFFLNRPRAQVPWIIPSTRSTGLFFRGSCLVLSVSSCHSWPSEKVMIVLEIESGRLRVRGPPRLRAPGSGGKGLSDPTFGF